MRDPLDDRQEDRLLRLEPLLRPTAADLADSAEVARMFRERVARSAPSFPPSAPAGAGVHGAPAGGPSGRDLSCTGAPAHTGADASAACLLPPPPSGSPAATAPVSPHAAPTGGAGISPVIEQGDAAHRGPVRNAERTSKPLSGVHAMGSARGASAAEPALGRSPARSLPLTDDGMAWGEAAPERRRLHPLACLALLLAASWLALMAVAAVAAAEAGTNALRGK